MGIIGEAAIFAFVRVWCVLRHPRLLLHFRRRLGQFPDAVTPSTIEEKFLWRKIFDRNPLFVEASDKLQSKILARRLEPELKVAEVLWSGDRPADIPDAALQGEVVVKANNGSHMYLFVRNADVDRAAVERAARRWMVAPYGEGKGEWAYRHVPRAIVIERMLSEDGLVPPEYKFHVGGGRTSYVYVRADPGTSREREVVLSRDGIPFALDSANGEPLRDFAVTPRFERLRSIAETLAQPFDFVRCDLYDTNDGIYFSELTIYPKSGFGTVKNRELAERRNSDWDLRRSWFLTAPQTGWRRRYAEALRSTLSAQ